MFLVVVCSPASARSKWVDQEVLTFKRLGGEDRILALIVAGEPNAADEECFPPSLRFQLGPDGELSDRAAHPIAADLRPDGDGKRMATLKLVAGLTGVALDQLVQREAQRRYRRLAATAIAGFSGMALTGALALYANARRIEADRESATARATSDYLVATFALANPTNENPRAVTAYTILERSAERARTELAGQPVVQARLIGTLEPSLCQSGAVSSGGGGGRTVDARGPERGPGRRAGPGLTREQPREPGALRRGDADHRARPRRCSRPGPRAGKILEARSAVIEGMAWRDKGDPVRSLRVLRPRARPLRGAPPPRRAQDRRRLAESWAAVDRRQAIRGGRGFPGAIAGDLPPARWRRSPEHGPGLVRPGAERPFAGRPPGRLRRGSTRRSPSSGGSSTPTTPSSPTP